MNFDTHMIKYVVIPGQVMSQSDGQIHYIDAPALMRLYKVNPKECVVKHGDQRDLGKDFSNLIRLRPRSNGDYELTTASEKSSRPAQR